MSDGILFDITFNIGNLNVGTWRRYLQVPTPEHLFLVFTEVIEAWGLERDPGQLDSYRTLSQEERVFVQKSFGLAMVKWTNEQEAKRHKKKQEAEVEAEEADMNIREIHISLTMTATDTLVANVEAGYRSRSRVYWSLSFPDGLLIHVHFEGASLPSEGLRSGLNQRIIDARERIEAEDARLR